MPRYPDLTPPNLNPDPSVIWVEGRSPIQFWDGPSRRRYNQFLELANEFGLHVHEAVALEDDNPRKRWTYKVVYLDDALAEIKRRPGISFEEWAKAWDAGSGQPTETDRRKARARATVALSKLVKAGSVHKYRSDEGALLLFPFGMGPLRKNPFERPVEYVISYRDRPPVVAAEDIEPAE